LHISELVSSCVVNAFGLIYEFVNGSSNFSLRGIVQVNSAFNSEGIASHNCRLGSSAFTNDKGGSGVGTLNSLIVVNNIVSKLSMKLNFRWDNLPHSIAGSGRLTKDET
jgi:hypothetical protein